VLQVRNASWRQANETEFLFGTSCYSLLSQDGQSEFGDAFSYCQMVLAQRTRMGKFMWLHRDPKFIASCKIVHDFADKYVANALREKHERKQDAAKDKGEYNFLQELAEEIEDPIELRNQLLHVLLAGRDTTASLLSNTFFVLAKRPDIWVKLQAEVATLGSECPSFEEMKSLKYLRYVLHECKLS
jgi:cytochrome P450